MGQSLSRFIKYYRSNFWINIALLTGTLVAGLGFYWITKTEYKSEVSFVLALEDRGSKFSAVFSQLGFDNGGGSDNAFTGENIMLLLQSKRLVRRTLNHRTPGENSNLLNHLISQNGIQQKWEKDTYLSTLVPFPDNLENLSPAQDSLIDSYISNVVIKKFLLINKVDKKLSYYTVQVTSTSEKFSRFFSIYLTEESSKFYIETKTEQARRNVEIIQRAADSLRRSLYGNVQQAASDMDRTFNLNPGLLQQRVPVQRNQLNVQFTSAAYGEVTKNLELARISLQKEMPLFSIIDMPPAKLAKQKPKLWMVLLISTLLGLIISLMLSGIKYINHKDQ